MSKTAVFGEKGRQVKVLRGLAAVMLSFRPQRHWETEKTGESDEAKSEDLPAVSNLTASNR